VSNPNQAIGEYKLETMKTENHYIHQGALQELDLHLQLHSTSAQMMRMQMMMRMI
jgi:hypothetical protein